MGNKVTDYLITIFPNINSAETRANRCPRSIAHQTACLAVELYRENPVVSMKQSSAAQNLVPFSPPGSNHLNKGSGLR